MFIKERLRKEFPLTKRVECVFECYEIARRRYAIFWEKKVRKCDIDSLLKSLEAATSNNFSEKKALLVIGDTDEEFEAEDLMYFNGADTFVVFYLKNTDTDKIYFNDQRVLWFGVDWKKIVRRFNEILK